MRAAEDMKLGQTGKMCAALWHFVSFPRAAVSGPSPPTRRRSAPLAPWPSRTWLAASSSRRSWDPMGLQWAREWKMVAAWWYATQTWDLTWTIYERIIRKRIRKQCLPFSSARRCTHRTRSSCSRPSAGRTSCTASAAPSTGTSPTTSRPATARSPPTRPSSRRHTRWASVVAAYVCVAEGSERDLRQRQRAGSHECLITNKLLNVVHTLLRCGHWND